MKYVHRQNSYVKNCSAYRLLLTLIFIFPVRLSAAPVDIFFLVDSTSDMDSNVAAFQSSFRSTILPSVFSTFQDPKVGIGSYQDFPVSPYGGISDSPFKVLSGLTSNQLQATAAAGQLSIGAGGDIAESALFALQMSASDPLGQIGWRSGSERLLFWLGNSPSQDGVTNAAYGVCCSGVGLNDAIAALNARNITTNAIDFGGLDSIGQASAISSATDGSVASVANAIGLDSAVNSKLTGFAHGIGDPGPDSSGGGGGGGGGGGSGSGGGGGGGIPVDFLFLFDTTSSMQRELLGFRAAVQNVLALSGMNFENAALGIAAYQDFSLSPFGGGGDSPFYLVSQLTQDAASFVSGADKLLSTASNTGDDPEANLFALSEAAGGAVTPIGWRPNSKRMILWFGDFAGHDGVLDSAYSTCCSSVGLSEAISSLQGANISVTAFDSGALDGAVGFEALSGQATAITSATRGAFYKVRTDSFDSAALVNEFERIAEEMNNSIPESGTFSLLSLGLAMLFCCRRGIRQM